MKNQERCVELVDWPPTVYLHIYMYMYIYIHVYLYTYTCISIYMYRVVHKHPTLSESIKIIFKSAGRSTFLFCLKDLSLLSVST